VYEPLLANSDFIRVSMAGKAPQEIVGLRRAFKNYPGKFLIQDVGSWQAYEGTRALGFNFFQGSFFTLPEIQKDKEISSGSLAKMQLMKELGNPDCQMDELARIISSDVSLSYRILKYSNSASFGFKTVISSIQQAVTLMGLREVRHWAMVVIMTQLDSSPKGEELSYIVLQRARFLSQLAEETEGFPISPSSMFMLGLFSKLDALLSATMEQALEDVPLEDDMRNGLCGEKNIYGDWLQLLTFIEAADWGNAKELLSANDVSHYLAATEYMKASSWAAALKPDS